MTNNEISLSIRNNIDSDDTKTTTTSLYSSEYNHNYIPKDLFSCLICYETFGLDQQQQLVALKCGHMFCATCIHQWFTTNKVCPTCRKRCWLKDILYIDVSTCIVAYGKKKIENLSVERDRLNNDIRLLKDSIETLRKNLKKTEYKFKIKQRLLHRLRYICQRKHR